MPKLKDHIIDGLNEDFTLCLRPTKYFTEKQLITKPNQNTCKSCLKRYNSHARLKLAKIMKQAGANSIEELIEKLHKLEKLSKLENL